MLDAVTAQYEQIHQQFRMFSGPPPYVPVTSWRPFAGLGMTIGLLISSLVPVALLVLGAKLLGFSASMVWLTMLATPLQQILLVGMTWWAAGLYDDRPSQVLALRAPPQGWKTYAVSFAVFVAGVMAMNLAITAIDPSSNKDDLKVFEEMFKSGGWWLALLMVGVGAPLSEEFLFRGFLFPAIAKSRAGVAGATLITSGVWASIHFYSVLGMIQVFVIGLLLSWILVRTGSLRVTMVCHGLYNTGLALAMLAGLGGWL